MRKIPVILDGDPGHDDAIAWLVAFARKELDVRGVVSVAGNVSLEKTTRNMRQILTLLGVGNVPMAAGARQPLVGTAFSAPSIHGESGLDGPALPKAVCELCDLSGVEWMARQLLDSEELMVLVPTGPLTNIATLLLAYPEVKAKIERISMMGGGLQSGNWTPAAEFNILADPEAAKIVFESGIPIWMAGLDVTEKAFVTPKDFERIRAVGGTVAAIVAEWLEFFYQFHQSIGYEGAPVHDPVAVTALVAPEILQTQDVYVQVETAGLFCRGATIADVFNRTGQTPNVRAILDIDREAYVNLIVDAVRYYHDKEAAV